MTEPTNEQDRLAKILTIGIISGVIAAGVNICYMLLYESATGFSLDQYINFLSVAIASIVPSVFVALLYFSLRRVMDYQKAYNAFLFIVFAIALLSFMLPLSNELPNGDAMPPEFTGLAIPMHIFAPLIYVFMISRAVPKK